MVTMSASPKALEEAKADATNAVAPMDSKSINGEMNQIAKGQTHRGLSSRHIQFLALGGCIGTGLFVGSGATLSTVGPGELMENLILHTMSEPGR